MKKNIEETKDEVKAQIDELTNDLQRTRADFENFRKQIEVQKENERKATKYATVMKVLPLIDDMNRAIETYEELGPLAKTMEKTLKDLNLAKIDSGEGVEFNPELHDAMMVDGEGEKEVIAETLRPGYYYEGEVLRPAMVKVKKI
ncbi:nucleotide exchange factor GrpE [Candidatus Saccharibacteria bacterium]|nr:nucleotide exchange factor GrpE [Candidatus Saccharibacteria bacterium]